MSSTESDSHLSKTIETNDLPINQTTVNMNTNEKSVNTALESIQTLQTPIIHNICPRTISGVLTQSNQNAIHWSSNGLIAFGCHNRVIIADTKKSVKVCQSMSCHVRYQSPEYDTDSYVFESINRFFKNCIQNIDILYVILYKNNNKL